MRKNLEQVLESCILLSKDTRFQRVLKAPLKMPMSKILQIISTLFNLPIKIRANLFWNEEMEVVIPEVVSLNLYRYGFFEEGSTKMILEYLKPGMTFFDIGAHFSYYTLLGSFIVGDEGKVHAFEPTPSTFNILKNNVVNKHNVTLNNLAVASKRKTVLINDYGIRYSAFNSLYGARLPLNVIAKLKPLQYKVEAISVDLYVENKNIRPDFIKIDAESSEYEILLGMRQTIEKFHPIITIEVGDYEVEDVHSSRDVIEFLINKGYKPYEYKDGKVVEHVPHNGVYKYDNILFLRR